VPLTVRIGARLAQYEITQHLGSGGMGDVYQATDSTLGRNVAVKFLPDSVAHDAERVARFEREARVLASLNHPNIAAIYGLEMSADKKFLVMELVPGETLADVIKSGESLESRARWRSFGSPSIMSKGFQRVQAGGSPA